MVLGVLCFRILGCRVWGLYQWGLYRGYIGIMKKKMGLLLRVQDVGFRLQGLGSGVRG